MIKSGYMSHILSFLFISSLFVPQRNICIRLGFGQLVFNLSYQSKTSNNEKMLLFKKGIKGSSEDLLSYLEDNNM